jgi:hypothetical protein
VPFWIFAIGFWLLTGAVTSAALSSAQPPLPVLPTFAVPEQLSYAISWTGIPVGESTLAVQESVDAEQSGAYHFVSISRSNHILRLLYPVKTRIDSVVEKERFLPIRYTMTGRQGFKTRNRELRFDQASHQVELVMDGVSRIYPTVEAVQDPLSALYYYRATATMRAGETVHIPVHDRKRPKEIVVTAGPVETVKTEAGTFQAVRLNVKQEEEGLFLHDGDITVWITADARRLPVRMEGRVAIGTVTAELTAYTPRPTSGVNPESTLPQSDQQPHPQPEEQRVGQPGRGDDR